MAGRARCWVCGLVLPQGKRGVCSACVDGLEGYCTRCTHRDACARLYRAASAARRLEGLQAPTYPPCLQVPAQRAPRPQLERIQRAAYGAPLVGVVVLLLASEDAVLEVESRHQAAIEAGVAELALAWGARLRRV